MENMVPDYSTFIVFVDKYDQLLMKEQVPTDRTFHLQHPDQTPAGAVAFRYYDLKTERGYGGVTFHNECNHSGWFAMPSLASAS